MALYEHASGERVLLDEGSPEDTRLGLLCMEPDSGWSTVDEQPEPAAEPPSEPAPAPAVERDELAADDTGADDDASDPEPDTTAAARPRRTARS